MDHSIRFPSLGKPEETGYTAYQSGQELSGLMRRGGNALAGWAAAWPTYGDGLVQHGPDYPVPAESLGDFCASLATYLFANPEAVGLVEKNWPDDWSREDIRFFRSVRWKEGRRAYYNDRERKVSAAESRKHDKRWHEVQEWMDGSPKAVVGLMYKHEYVEDGLLFRLSLWRNVKRVLDEQEGDAAPYCNLTTDKDLGLGEREHAWLALQAFEAVDELVRSFRLRESAERSLGCWRHNTENRKRPAADKEAGGAA